jgi:flagellar biosynthesis/type III secretory pathway protein FliH
MYVDALAEGIEKGKAEGMADGAQQGLRELVITGNKNGLSKEQIQTYFNLDGK